MLPRLTLRCRRATLKRATLMMLMSSTSCSSSSAVWSHLPRLALRCPRAILRRNIPPSLLDRVVLRVLLVMLLMPTSWPPHRVGRRVLLMMLITFYVTPVDTALSPGNSEAGDFDVVDVNNFVLLFERCVVSFTPVGTWLSPGYSEEKYTAFASSSCCSPCVANDVNGATVFALCRVGRSLLLMMLITFYFTPVDTALSPGNSEAGDFDDVDVNNFVFIFGRCVVSFTQVGTALSPGYSEEKYTAFASTSCCSLFAVCC
jgi:hypothetical protein